MIDSEHSFGEDCAGCGNGRSGVNCVHRRYGARKRAFYRVQAHRWELATAAYAPSRATSTDLLSRMARELDSLPHGHTCMCFCPRERAGYPTCPECKRFRSDQKNQEPAEFGRTAAVHPPSPLVEALDMACGHL